VGAETISEDFLLTVKPFNHPPVFASATPFADMETVIYTDVEQEFYAPNSNEGTDTFTDEENNGTPLTSGDTTDTFTYEVYFQANDTLTSTVWGDLFTVDSSSDPVLFKI
jgi:hypothetical protein